MITHSSGSFFTRFTRKLFRWRIEHEIYDRMMPHVRQERDYGYTFATNEELKAQTDTLRVQSLLDTVEQQILNMPEGYGLKFRHIMHSDLIERLRMYEQVARHHVRRPCDPRLVATSLEVPH